MHGAFVRLIIRSGKNLWQPVPLNVSTSVESPRDLTICDPLYIMLNIISRSHG